MRLEKDTKAERRKKTKTRILKWVLALAVILIVLMVFLVPAFVSSEKGRKIILTKINNSIDGKVDFAGLSMSWLKGVKVTDFNFQDSTGQTLVRIGQIETKPHYAAILFGTLSFGKTIIDEPVIVINLKPKQIHKTKVSPQKPAGNKELQLPMIPIKKIDLTINNGNVKVTDRQAETVAQIKIHKGEFSQVSKAGKTRLEGQVDCEYDWSAVSTVAGPFLPEGLKLQGKRRDTINFTSEYPTGRTDKLLANLTTKVKLGFEKAYYKGLTFSPTEAEIRILKGLFTISQFSSKVNNGVFRFAAEADFKQKPTLLTTLGPIQIAEGIQLNDEMSRELLVYINPIFADAFNVSGVGNLNCKRLVLPLRGKPKKELEIVGTLWADNINMSLSQSGLLGQLLSLAGLHLREQNIRVHPTSFILQNSRLQYDDMRIDVGDNPFNFKGVIGLDKSLDMVITLPYTLDGRTVRVGEEKSAKRIAIPLKGTIEKPELDLGKLLEMQLRKQLEQELLKGLEKLFK